MRERERERDGGGGGAAGAAAGGGGMLFVCLNVYNSVSFLAAVCLFLSLVFRSVTNVRVTRCLDQRRERSGGAEKHERGGEGDI